MLRGFRVGILYAPDYVINVGGAMAIIGIEILGWTPARAENELDLDFAGVTRFRPEKAGSIVAVA
jgi:glutamate dehydrogenase/leucine dehydrogenase